MAGQRCKGVGVDCTHFVCAVFDELLGIEPTELPRATQDSMLHGMSSQVAMEAWQQVNAAHRVSSVLPDADGTLEVFPGDALIHRIGRGGGAGHVMLVSLRRSGGRLVPICYHSQRPRGVTLAPLPAPDTLLHVWRSDLRHRWKGPLGHAASHRQT